MLISLYLSFFADIAEYDPSAFHSNSKISYLEPKTYSNIISLVEGPPIKSRPRLRVSPRSGNRQPVLKTMDPIQSRPLPPLPSTKGPDSSSKLESNMYITPKHEEPISENKEDPGRLSPEPDYDKKGEIEDDPGPVRNKAPFPGPRFTRPVVPESATFTHNQKSSFPAETNSQPTRHFTDQPYKMSTEYLNDIPRATLSPTVNRERHQPETFRRTSSERATEIFDHRTKGRIVKNVEELSICEVNEYLNFLKLGHFGEKFRDNLIDGTLLVELTEKMLRDVFGMNRVESLRLLKFAKEGYIPT